MWNSVGKAIIILTHVEVDKSGKSYYGESHLYYLTVDGKFDCNIQLKKKDQFMTAHGIQMERNLL